MFKKILEFLGLRDKKEDEYIKRIMKKIDDHFANITDKELEKGLKRADWTSKNKI